MVRRAGANCPSSTQVLALGLQESWLLMLDGKQWRVCLAFRGGLRAHLVFLHEKSTETRRSHRETGRVLLLIATGLKECLISHS